MSASKDSDVVELPQEYAQMVEEIAIARRNEKEWKSYEDSRKASLKRFLAGRIGTVKGKVVCAVSTKKGNRTVDYDRLIREFPDASAACVSVGNSVEVLRVTP